MIVNKAMRNFWSNGVSPAIANSLMEYAATILVLKKRHRGWTGGRLSTLNSGPSTPARGTEDSFSAFIGFQVGPRRSARAG
jgi:hypothetical protein